MAFGIDDAIAAVEIGVPLIGKIVDLIAAAKTASAEEHAAIVASLRASDEALDARAVQVRQLEGAETAKTEAQIAQARAEMPKP